MPKLSELVQVVSSVTGWPRGNVALYARYAREGGFISQGARGVAAPDMTIEDAANLLCAILSSEQAKLAPGGISHLRNIEGKMSGSSNIGIFESALPSIETIEIDDVSHDNPMWGDDALPRCLSFISKKHTFWTFIYEIIAAATDRRLEDLMANGDSLPLSIRISVLQNAPYAEVNIFFSAMGKLRQFHAGVNIYYSTPGFSWSDSTDLKIGKFISERSILHIGHALR